MRYLKTYTVFRSMKEPAHLYGAEDEATKRLKSVRAAVTKLEKLLYEEEW